MKPGEYSLFLASFPGASERALASERSSAAQAASGVAGERNDD